MEWIKNLVWNRRLQNTRRWERTNSESLIEGESFDQATKILNSIRDELISKVSVVEIGLVSQAFAFFDGEYRHRYCLIPTMAGKNKEGYDVVHFQDRWKTN
ncbi:hypothetical protein BSK66_27775 [Paenibacillus odorifer]|uniref:hypothetical protein n=1 Tax=Paenibacillus TaxID=44249 RepID=UPI0003E219D1|nr:MULTISPECIES: hypothetical protein [Paenibacillus]ETT61277.1 hypothetical protein C171_12473 [Paenibacillus sp. FSL H8-237]OMD13757.1 hypothetical protein BJP47_24325 [Paenibacillus odorifer]OME48987.1 hypothetical protein BSK66_27775 [Paenibacillus odorifer]